MRTLAPEEWLADVACPACDGLVAPDPAGARCEACARIFPTREGVVDFVVVEALDEDGRREHAANAVDLASSRAVRRRLRKGENNPFLMAQARRGVRAAAAFMPAGGDRTLVSLGSGTAFELRVLLGMRSFRRVFSTDIAWSTTALVPQVTAPFEGDLGTFAADFDRFPLRRDPDVTGFLYLALHHAPDPHATLGRLLDRSFDDLVMVEPVTNRLVALLARLGLAQRVEYSGLRPVWLDLREVRRVAHERGYEVQVETWWEIPRDRVPRRLRTSAHGWRPLYVLGEAFSAALRPLRLGSMAAIRVHRRHDR